MSVPNECGELSAMHTYHTNNPQARLQHAWYPMTGTHLQTLPHDLMCNCVQFCVIKKTYNPGAAKVIWRVVYAPIFLPIWPIPSFSEPWR